MSTRCQVHVIQEGMWEEEVMLYHHSDGYPRHMIPILQKGFKLCAGPRVDKRVSYTKQWEAGRAGKSAAWIVCADPGRFDVESGLQLHGDIQYLYVVYCMNMGKNVCAWEVEVFNGFGENIKNKLLLNRTNVMDIPKDLIENNLNLDMVRAIEDERRRAKV